MNLQLLQPLWCTVQTRPLPFMNETKRVTDAEQLCQQFEMSVNVNNIGEFVDCFRKVCSELEKKAEINFVQIKKDCKEDCIESEKSLQKFNELMSSVAELCSEMNSNSEVINAALKQNFSENALILPHGLQSDFVKCINGLYNTKCPTEFAAEEKLINEKNERLINELIKSGERSIRDMKSIESTLIEARENLKVAQSIFYQ